MTPNPSIEGMQLGIAQARRDARHGGGAMHDMSGPRTATLFAGPRAPAYRSRSCHAIAACDRKPTVNARVRTQGTLKV